MCADRFGMGNAAPEKSIGGVDRVAAERVGVGEGEEELRAVNLRSYFFLHFASQPVCDAFAGVDKASGQVKRSLGRFSAAAHAEQFSCRVQDNRHRGSSGIGVKREAAVGATPAVGIIV